VDAQYDASSHQCTGRRIWKTARFAKHVDATSPILAQAAVTNEVYTKASLSCVRPKGDGTVIIYHHWEFTNGSIVMLNQFHGNTHNDKSASISLVEQHSNETEVFEITFDGITEVIDGAGGKSFNDMWSVRQ
jgi:type VI secretion system Hcp family effector